MFPVKCTIGACNAIIPTFTAYQYPTYMRNLGIGSGNLAAGAALVIVPYLFLLVSSLNLILMKTNGILINALEQFQEHVNVHLPMSIMGVAGLVGAVALIFLKDKLSKKPKAADTR